MMRWSYGHRQVVHRRTTIWPVLDDGAVLGRVHAEDGRLRRVDDRVDSIEPNTPPLEIENGARRSAPRAQSLPSLRLWPYSAIFFSMSAKLIWSALRRIGTTRPRGEPTGDADVEVAVVDDVVAVDRRR
jgi:hypothetical protein